MLFLTTDIPMRQERRDGPAEVEPGQGVREDGQDVQSSPPQHRTGIQVRIIYLVQQILLCVYPVTLCQIKYIICRFIRRAQKR
jgi:hypothetical protein